jgi:hypothetical protein
VTTDRELPEPIGVKTTRRLRHAVALRAAGGRWALWSLRAFVWAVLIAAALLLVRQIAAPSTVEVVDAALDQRLAADARDWPVDEARDLAVRVVTDALTLPPDTSASHTAPMVEPGRDTLAQTVQTVTPGRVEVLDADRATVHLGVRLHTVMAGEDLDTTGQTPTDADGEPVEVEREVVEHWRWVAVPILRDPSGHVAAAGGLVEIPPPHTVELPAGRFEPDSGLTDETRELAEALFAAWAGDSRTTLDALTDSSIPLLATDVELETVEGWRVARPPSRGTNTGRPTELTGEADVAWTQPGGTRSVQTYTVHLAREGERWHVTHLGPAHPQPANP